MERVYSIDQLSEVTENLIKIGSSLDLYLAKQKKNHNSNKVPHLSHPILPIWFFNSLFGIL